MATNFELIIPITKPMTMADGSKKIWTIDELLAVINAHNCTYIISPHPCDELSNFEHWHVGIHTTSDNVYATIAKWFGVLENSVGKIKGKFTSTYALYLAHLDKGSVEAGKTPIDTSLIIDNVNLDYNKLCANIKAKDDYDKILSDIANGRIRKYQFDDLLPETFRIKHSRQIDVALRIWNERKMKGAREMEKTVIWIWGNAGLGKTELAKYYAKQSKMDYYLSSSGDNPFDDYADQPCIILDDVGTDNLNGKVILKLFDPYNKTFTKARYSNKAIDSDLIIVTSSQSPEKFWMACRDSYGVDGSWEQLTRRLTGGCFHFVDSNTVKVTMYDSQGKNPCTLSMEVPSDVRARTVTVTAQDRLNSFSAKFGLTLTDDNKIAVSGVIEPKNEQLTLGFVQVDPNDPNLPFN